jgi:hypothetical protein
MKNYSYILTAGLLLILASCSEKVKISPEQEESFVKYYGNAYEDYGRDVKEVPGKGYAVVGTTTTVKESQKADKDILFLLTDKTGNLLKEPLTFGGSGDEEGNSLALTADGGFVIAGTYTDTSNQETDVMVIRLEKNGNQLWTRIIPQPGNQAGNSVKISATGNILIAGYSVNTTLLLEMEDSETGTVTPLKAPPPIANCNYAAVDVQKFTDGLRLIGSTTNISNGNSWLLIVEYPAGESSFGDATPVNPTAQEKAYGSTYITPDTILVCGIKKGQDGQNTGLLRKIARGVSKFDIIFEKNFGGSGQDVTGKSVRMLNDGRIAVLATRTIAENSDIVIYLFDRDGHQMEAEPIFLGDNSIQEAGAFEITPDGGFIITGSNLLDNNSMVSLIKLNAKGELH